MNTTTITINWEDYEGYIGAIQAVGKSVVNTFSNSNELYDIEMNTHHMRYTPEKLKAALDHFECFGKSRKIREKAYCRFFVWRYCYSKFDLTTTDIALVTEHNRSMVSIGLQRVQDYQDNPKLQAIKREVYAKCDEIFQ
jgi:hypothetical protein